MEALPESRMILLVRDPRDVAASALDGHRRGGHAYRRAIERLHQVEKREANRADDNPNSFIEAQANRYLRNVGNALQAYESHEGHKAFVKYEDLLADTFGEMSQVYSALQIPVDEEELSQAVDRHSWENVSEEEKGPGKFNRKATPGSWREDLSTE
jgi:hypothetical protein